MATKAAARAAKEAEAKKTETRRMVLAAAAACEDKKAEDVRILELDPADSGFTDFFLIASGTNERQVQAIGDEIEGRMKREFATYPNSVEGRRQSEWILLDYVDFVVHIFSAERRAFYDIERLRKTAQTLDQAAIRSAIDDKPRPAARKASAKKTALPKPTGPKPAAKKTAIKKVAARKATAKTAGKAR